MLEKAGKYIARASLVAGLLSVPTGSAFAQDTEEQVSPGSPQLEDRGHSTPLVWFEPEVSARFRPEMLIGGDLGPGQSPVKRGLGESDQGLSTIGWASTRLRMNTIIHAGSRLA
ncbi:MAG: hypothetical protein VYE15_00470, partial [Myxococcota bacterium]|nr:hypothetical protein [Myxococcota bacterium]